MSITKQIDLIWNNDRTGVVVEESVGGKYRMGCDPYNDIGDGSLSIAGPSGVHPQKISATKTQVVKKEPSDAPPKKG